LNVKFVDVLLSGIGMTACPGQISVQKVTAWGLFAAANSGFYPVGFHSAILVNFRINLW
jgi:hypothetical protein